MTYSHLDPVAQHRAPWIFGVKVEPTRALNQKQFWGIRFFLDCATRIKDRALFGFAIDSKRLLAASLILDRGTCL